MSIPGFPRYSYVWSISYAAEIWSFAVTVENDPWHGRWYIPGYSYVWSISYAAEIWSFAVAVENDRWHGGGLFLVFLDIRTFGPFPMRPKYGVLQSVS